MVEMGGEFTRVRRNRWITGLAASPFVVALMAIVGGILASPPIAGAALHFTVLGALASAYAWRKNPWPRIEPTKVSVDDEALVVGEQRIPRAHIKAAYLVTRGIRSTVKVVRRGVRLPIELEVDDEKSGQELLRALGFDVTQATASFRTMSKVFEKSWWLFAAIAAIMAVPALVVAVATAAGLGHALGAVAGIPGALGLMGLVGAILVPGKLEVGADGVMVRWLWHKRFVRHEDIVNVGVVERGTGRQRRLHVQLLLESSETLEIPVGDTTFGREKVQLITARIGQAIEAQRAGASAADAALLARKGRPHRDWVTALRGLKERATHRTAPIAAQTLWRIVEDPGGEPVARAAAAVALRDSIRGDERKRLARVANATAAPRLRIALERAAAVDADEEALAEALAEVEEEEEELDA
jgi:hypothetical protein